MQILLGLNVLLVIGTVLAGVYHYFGEGLKEKKQLKRIMRWNIAIFAPVMMIAIGMIVPDIAYAAETGAATSASGLGFIAAALCTGLATIGAGYAVGAVGSSALGAVSEDPKILGKTLIFVGLAEGIAIYGLIISILILGRL
ncbi:ATP synthase subunit C [Acidaminobacter hydrogenoformans]|uniref:V/A-type H+-transporting ATPase subunit K n=1 Tax=Acidaminobacter hydrogenoformans DSM 2784 TaxID=1120920 RepID=A0A1G5S3E1_9FIRM|nr:ATP synthase subunit C [Acidaminobacter hydrogenoformans]SCZ80647.1 V/A-type H+-transporting ATPase subunit K [Acidaminobacter hydrogenoformans DSM 2784]